MCVGIKTTNIILILKELSKKILKNLFLNYVGRTEQCFFMCIEIFLVPTAPLSQKYEFFHSRKDSDHMRFMRIKWKPPVYTGNSVYSYNIRMVEESTGLWVQFPFEMNFYHLIMERQTDEWIRSPAIWVKGFGLILKVEISAINAAGEGEALKFETVGESPTFSDFVITSGTTREVQCQFM